MKRKSNLLILFVTAALALLVLPASAGLSTVPNDLCDSPDTVLAGIDYPGSTVGATGTNASSCADNDANDVWYSYTPTASGLVSITLSDCDFDSTFCRHIMVSKQC